MRFLGMVLNDRIFTLLSNNVGLLLFLFVLTFIQLGECGVPIVCKILSEYCKFLIINGASLISVNLN